MHPGKDDYVILEKSTVDAEKGFATQPMSHEELVKHSEGQDFRLIRRFVITQSTGKQRIIDDAAAGGQSEASTDENMLGFCNALQPAHHLAALASELTERGMPWPKDEGVTSGGEDWPDAYRYTPCALRNPGRVWWCGGTRKGKNLCFRGITDFSLDCLMQLPPSTDGPSLPRQ